MIINNKNRIEPSTFFLLNIAIEPQTSKKSKKKQKKTKKFQTTKKIYLFIIKQKKILHKAIKKILF